MSSSSDQNGELNYSNYYYFTKILNILEHIDVYSTMFGIVCEMSTCPLFVNTRNTIVIDPKRIMNEFHVNICKCLVARALSREDFQVASLDSQQFIYRYDNDPKSSNIGYDYLVENSMQRLEVIINSLLYTKIMQAFRLKKSQNADNTEIEKILRTAFPSE